MVYLSNVVLAGIREYWTTTRITPGAGGWIEVVGIWHCPPEAVERVQKMIGDEYMPADPNVEPLEPFELPEGELEIMCHALMKTAAAHLAHLRAHKRIDGHITALMEHESKPERTIETGSFRIEIRRANKDSSKAKYTKHITRKGE